MFAFLCLLASVVFEAHAQVNGCIGKTSLSTCNQARCGCDSAGLCVWDDPINPRRRNVHASNESIAHANGKRQRLCDCRPRPVLPN
jgi:hypothetical protein